MLPTMTTPKNNTFVPLSPVASKTTRTVTGCVKLKSLDHDVAAVKVST